MSVAPKILYPCDHVIVEKTKCADDYIMTRSKIAGFPDQVPANISFIRIDEVVSSDGTKEYTKGIHYTQQSSLNIIEWLNVQSVPSPGESYIVRGLYIKTSTVKQDADNCDRCCGNGWYADILGDAEANIFTGEQKLLQDIVKVLFTEKQDDGYGSTIQDIIGSNIYNEVDLSLQVSSIIDDCANQIKTSQREYMNKGIDLPMGEMLKDIEVSDIVFIREDSTCYIKIQIFNALNAGIEFTFKV